MKRCSRLVSFVLTVSIILSVVVLSSVKLEENNAEGLFEEKASELLTEDLEANHSVKNVEKLYGYDLCEEYSLVNLNPLGYAIFHRETKEILEYNFDVYTPYYDVHKINCECGFDYGAELHFYKNNGSMCFYCGDVRN